MKIIISFITTLLLLFFIFMIIYLFPDKKTTEKFSNKNIEKYSNTIDEPISDSLIPYNPYAKIQLDEYQVIETFKYILKRTPTIPEINRFIYYTINELKEFLYNSPEYEKLIKIQDNIVNSGIEAAIAKKNLINRIMHLYKNVYDIDVPIKMILPLKDCFIYLQLNIYLFMVMLESSNYSFFENSVLSSYILTKKILLELFNKYFNILELKIYAEEKINKLSSIEDANGDKYIISKIEIANIIKDLIVINNDYLLIKIKTKYPSIFNEILKNTIGVEKLSLDKSDIIELKKYLNNLNNLSNTLEPTSASSASSGTSGSSGSSGTSASSASSASSGSSGTSASSASSGTSEASASSGSSGSSASSGSSGNNVNTAQSFSETYQNAYSLSTNPKIKENFDAEFIRPYYDEYKRNKDNMSKTNPRYYDDYLSYGYYNYLRNNTAYPKIIFNIYDEYKKNKDNISTYNQNYYDDYLSADFYNYFRNNHSDIFNSLNINSETQQLLMQNQINYVDISDVLRTDASYYQDNQNRDMPYRGNYMSDLIYDKDNSSVLRLYNPIVHNKSYLLPSGYRPPVCTSLGQEQLTQPVFTESKLLFQGLDINKAFTDTQVGSIMPKFIYNEFKDIKIK